LFGTNRRARRNQQKKQQETKGRNQSFYDAIKKLEEDNSASPAKAAGVKPVGIAEPEKQNLAQKEIDTDHTKYRDDIPEETMGTQQEGVLTSSGSVADAPGAKPEITTVIVDEQTGFERIAQGKAVMDVVTRQAVKLSDLGPMYRMAQFSPGVPPQAREAFRFDWETVTVPLMIESLREVCKVELNAQDGSTYRDIPPHPQVSNLAIEFVIANRDYLGHGMKKALGRLKLRAQSEGNVEEAREYRKLWKHFMTLEDHISAPFRQMVLDAEGKIGPNFGNLDLQSFIGKELYERSASYVVLKAMVAHWEKKVRDSDFIANNPQTKDNFMTVLATGDPKRYLPDPPIIFQFDECVKVCAMAQKMTKEFVETPTLFDDLPAEIRFIEKALELKGGTELRRYIIEEYCPAEQITPEALREGMRRFHQQMINMQIDPYGDFTNLVGRLVEAMSVGTPDQRDPYGAYNYNLSRDKSQNPGYFQTYTFNEDKNSLVRFLDQAVTKKKGTVGGADDVASQIGKELSFLFGGGAQKSESSSSIVQKTETYKVPDGRSIGRPHSTGWLDLLEEDRVDNKDIYEADNWREVNKAET